MEISVEFWPWNSYDKLLGYARKALETYPYDRVWLCDEFQYEDALTVLAAMAIELKTSVGTLVTFPWRNPLELAQRFSTMSKLTPPDRDVAIGLGAGGAVQVQIMSEKSNPMSVMRESVILLRELLAGGTIELGRFPELAGRFRYNTKRSSHLYFPPSSPVPVYLAAGGPGMCRLAGEVADGVVMSQLVLRSSWLGYKTGLLDETIDIIDASRPPDNAERPFKRIYNTHLSVARDSEKAKLWARRNTSYGLAGTYLRYPDVLGRLGVDRKEVAYISEAYTSGLGVDAAAERVPLRLVDEVGAVTAGTPDEIIPPLAELARHLQNRGFDHLVIGVPLGPDIPEALELLGREVIPAVKAALAAPVVEAVRR